MAAFHVKPLTLCPSESVHSRASQPEDQPVPETHQHGAPHRGEGTWGAVVSQGGRNDGTEWVKREIFIAVFNFRCLLNVCRRWSDFVYLKQDFREECVSLGKRLI